LDLSRDAMDENEPLAALVGGASDAGADEGLNGFTTCASANSLSWSPS